MGCKTLKKSSKQTLHRYRFHCLSTVGFNSSDTRPSPWLRHLWTPRLSRRHSNLSHRIYIAVCLLARVEIVSRIRSHTQCHLIRHQRSSHTLRHSTNSNHKLCHRHSCHLFKPRPSSSNLTLRPSRRRSQLCNSSLASMTSTLRSRASPHLEAKVKPLAK